MKYKFVLALFVAAGLSACAAKPVKPVAAQTGSVVAKSEAQAAKRVVKAPELPKQKLTEQILYEFLLAEVAGQRGDLNLATEAYRDLAMSTRDPRVAQRATEVALFARATQQALETATLWQELDPESAQARQTTATLLLSVGRFDQAKVMLEQLIAADKDAAGNAFLQLNNLLSRHVDKKAALELVQSLAAPYPDLPEAHMAVAQAAWNADQFDVAQSEIRRAANLRPDWEMAALFQGQLLQRKSKAEAVVFFAGFLKSYPQAKEARHIYAKLLAGERRYAESLEQFKQLLAEFPRNPDLAMAAGMLSIQLNALEAAQGYLKQALDNGVKDEGSVRIALGQVNEELKRYDEAARWYQSVEGGEEYLSAQVKYAQLLAKQNKLSEARLHLQQLSLQNNQMRVQAIQAEATLLRDAKAFQEAYDVLSRGLEKLPNYPDLLYDRAMMAEKINRMDVMEQDLRKLIQIKPDNAHAYNALGYSLADRGDRLNEALQLIEKALSMVSGDPFVLDSMGWVQYRLGNHVKALEFLRRAYATRADPEIAAHIGEVLWKQGNRAEAQEVWQSSLKDNPQNESLLDVIKKFKP